MDDLSLFILDLAENGLAAGADRIEIHLEIDRSKDHLALRIADNGSGMNPDDAARAADPFFTTRITRRIGLGLALLKQAAQWCDGSFQIDSAPGAGTLVRAEFRLSHPDLPPWGDMVSTLMTLIVGRPEADFIVHLKKADQELVIDSREIKTALEGASLSNPLVIRGLKNILAEGLSEFRPG